eukprot:c19679_g1_i8.p1 GENE.c19679_g1_i8~~c19679_g1_i8.p1  ORF type:complete len:124 (+),score=13.29 c19679_g1_i8:274-645(+)
MVPPSTHKIATSLEPCRYERAILGHAVFVAGRCRHVDSNVQWTGENRVDKLVLKFCQTALQWAESQGKDHAAAAIREFSRAKHKVQFRMFLIGTHFRAGRGSAVRTLPIDILMLVSLQVLREL